MSRPVKRDIKFELMGLALVAFSLLALAGFITPAVGKIGQFISRILEVTAGRGRFLVPVFLAVLGINLLIRGRLTPSTRGVGVIILFSTFLTYLHTSFPPEEAFSYAMKGMGGGLLGALPARILLPYFGTIGTDIILATLFLAGITLVTGLSIVELVSSTTSKLWSGLMFCWKRLVDYLFPVEEVSDQDRHKTTRPKAKEKNGKKNKKKQAAGTEAQQEPETSSTGLQIEIYENQSTEHESRSGDTGENFLDLNPASNHQSSFSLPSPAMLKPINKKGTKNDHTIRERSNLLEQILASFGINATVINVSAGPAITRYEIQPPPGIKVSKIAGLSDDIALGLATSGVRIEAPIPGKAAVGIEVPNPEINSVPLRELLESKEFTGNSSRLTVALGKDIAGNPVVADLGRMPHLLVAGATGSGKSVCINTLICSILFKATPEEVKLLMVDPKMVELANYNGIPHLVSPVVTDPKKAAGALRWAVREMEQRYELFAATGVRDITRYNQLCREENQTTNAGRSPARTPGNSPGFRDKVPHSENTKPEKTVVSSTIHTRIGVTAQEKDGSNISDIKPEQQEHTENTPAPLPYIVIIIDELADLMMVAPSDVEDAICRLAQMARACGIHLVIATQRPSVDVITGLIKANIPSRISFAVSSQTDSRTILDMGGAEKLLGKGDMLFYPVGAPKPLRVQGAFLSDSEVDSIVEFLKKQANPVYNEEVLQQPEESTAKDNDDWDDLLPQAAQIFIESGTASISMLQRRLHIGYARAARLVDIMERRAIIGGYEGSKPRQVLMTWDQYRQVFGEKQAQVN